MSTKLPTALATAALTLVAATPDRPTTWIVFTTKKHFDPRQLVATVDGRSYRIAGPTTRTKRPANAGLSC